MPLDNADLVSIFGRVSFADTARLTTMRPLCCAGKHRVGSVWFTGVSHNRRGELTYCAEHGIAVVEEIRASGRSVAATTAPKTKPVKKKMKVEETGELL